MFGIAVNNIFTIKGVEDKRCIFTQEIEAEGEREEVMICALDRQSSAQLAEYYGKYFAAGGNIEASGTVDLASGVSTVTETINGEQVVNPLNGLFSKGVCVAAGMAPADTPAIQLAPGVSLEITNPDGAVTKYTTDEQGNTVMLTQ
jgi:hypothetical protein